MRDTGPLKKEFNGDTETALAQMGLSRTLIGQLKEVLMRNGVTNVAREVNLPDGTNIRVASIGGIDRVRITTPTTAEAATEEQPSEMASVEEPTLPETTPFTPQLAAVNGTASLSGISMENCLRPALMNDTPVVKADGRLYPLEPGSTKYSWLKLADATPAGLTGLAWIIGLLLINRDTRQVLPLAEQPRSFDVSSKARTITDGQGNWGAFAAAITHQAGKTIPDGMAWLGIAPTFGDVELTIKAKGTHEVTGKLTVKASGKPVVNALVYIAGSTINGVPANTQNIDASSGIVYELSFNYYPTGNPPPLFITIAPSNPACDPKQIDKVWDVSFVDNGSDSPITVEGGQINFAPYAPPGGTGTANWKASMTYTDFGGNTFGFDLQVIAHMTYTPPP